VIKNLTQLQFGERGTQDKWHNECREAKAAGRERGARYIVAPRHSLPSESGLISAGTEVFSYNFDGFSFPYAGADGTEQVPISRADALQRALDRGIVLDCWGAAEHRAAAEREAATVTLTTSDGSEREARQARRAEKELVEPPEQAQA
jgi:hypothetical protein